MPAISAAMACWFGLMSAAVAGWAQGTTTPDNASVAAQKAADAQPAPLKTLDDHFPFIVPETVEQWQERAADLRQRVLVATGLWPLPERTPLAPVIYGKVARDGFTVERVYFQSLPGHFVSGLLFRPTGEPTSPRPGVLSPHGHGGRMQSFSDEDLAAQIKSGGERFEQSGRTPKLARCAQLARMGCVCFIFDMLGYGDSHQVAFEVAHRHRDPRPEESADGPWCFYSPAADLRLQSIMGLQTWNALRALDFLAGLPDVDPERLAVTGGSGGGTQSILLGAIDERLKVSFPNGMVSTSMQGGCYCENCCYLRIGTGNVELAALFAPRPQAMTAADDWTKEMMTDGYPELQQLYAMLGDKSNVYCRPLLHFKHNYNYVTRATMYEWMNRHLDLGLDSPIVEADFEPLTEQETSVWNEQHPAPTQTGIEHERAVLQWWDEQSQAKLFGALPTSSQELTEFHQAVGSAWRVIFDVPSPAGRKLSTELLDEHAQGDVRLRSVELADASGGAPIPLLIASPTNETPKLTVIWADGSGQAIALGDDGQPTATLQALLDAGAEVIVPDLSGQGQQRAADLSVDEQRLIDDNRDYSAFTFGYNRPLVAKRVRDLLAVIASAATSEPGNVCLLGTGESAPWAIPAAALAGPLLSRAAVDTHGFRYAQAGEFKSANFVPGAVKYGDVDALLALRAPYPMLIQGEAAIPPLSAAAYKALDASEEIVSSHGDVTDAESFDWLLR